MASRQINLRLPDELLAEIDDQRGLVPRNAWIVACLTAGGANPKNPIVEAPTPEATRSPEPGIGTGHREGCKCLSCERARGHVS